MAADGDLKEVVDIIEKQGRAFEEFKATNDELLKAKAAGKAVAELEEKLKRVESDLDKFGDLKAQLDAVQLAQKRGAAVMGDAGDIETELKKFNVARKSAGATDVLSVEQYQEYKTAFDMWSRKGDRVLSPEHARAMQAGIDTQGGYLLPHSTMGRIVTRMFETSSVRRLASVQVISTEALEGLYDRDEASFGWVGETESRTETNTPTLGGYKIDAHEMYAAPKTTQKLLDDAAVDVEGWLAGKVADKFTRGSEAAFVSGNGVSKPRGFASYTTAATADDSRTWGQMEHVISGANGAFASTSPADCLFSLIGALQPRYLPGAVWATKREVITAIRKLKEATTNAYMWQPGLQAGQPDRLLGYPIEIMADMAALATGSLSMAFGNFREGYQIVDRLGIRVLRDPFTAKPYVIFYTTARVGGGVLDFDAIKFLKFSA